MDIAVLGTGSAGRTIAARLNELGHHVVVGTRDPSATAAGRTMPSGPPPSPGSSSRRTPTPPRGELAFVVTNGLATLDVLGLAGSGNLAGKVLVDVSNPLDFSQGFPPTLFVKDTDSLAEQIQRAHPDALVVKALNTMNASVMVRPDSLSDPAVSSCRVTTRRPRPPSPGCSRSSATPT